MRGVCDAALDIGDRLRKRGAMGFHLSHGGHRSQGGRKTKRGGQRRQCDTQTHDIVSNDLAPDAGLCCCLGRERRHFAVKPILFVGESPPRLRHTQVAPERRLAFSAFRKPQAVLRVIPEQV